MLLNPIPPSTTLHSRVGGDQFFFDLVEHFYTSVEHDSVLRPLYPADLAPSKQHLALFLIQYWGGPRTYDQERGHPRLRMRHFPFAIGERERDAWMAHMRSAVDASEAPPEDKQALIAYFEMAATSLINQPR
jgi:hemoglobin